MAKKFFYNKVYNTKRTIINGIIIGVCAIGVLICFILVSSFEGEDHRPPKANLSIKNEVVMEINENYTKEIFFSKVENVNLEDIEINYPIDYDTSKIGEYKVVIVVEEKEYPVNVKIVDTTKPELILQDIKISKNSTYKLQDFVISCKDNSNEDCKLSYAGIDEEGNEIDYSKYIKEGEYQIKIAAKDSSGNQVVKETKLIIGKPNNSGNNENDNNPTTPPTVTCKYGNNIYDKEKYLLAADISTNGCAVSLDLYKSESMTKEINKIMETETTKIKRDVEGLNLTGTLALNRKVTAVTNTTGDGIIGYELRMIVTITNNYETKTVVEYRVNNEGKRVFVTNPYNLKK